MDGRLQGGHQPRVDLILFIDYEFCSGRFIINKRIANLVTWPLDLAKFMKLLNCLNNKT